ncbi:hypothetical protein [Burkholderia sp. Tr-20390]|uniref:hypothetical protein n=1 Tax=Burkholderia sp. Tr-20390 TaxID=2703904 RepID=UPI00197E614C|nr:hypothetical protein [Burkholderia sp. Tr-20390]MBN3729452.1 hypothetical protein [Burkholderia sp. Tr-20390]
MNAEERKELKEACAVMYGNKKNSTLTHSEARTIIDAADHQGLKFDTKGNIVEQRTALTAGEKRVQITLCDFPAVMQKYAKRNERFSGRGTPDCPYIGGWTVEREAASYDDEAKNWLKSQGFAFKGRRWYRADKA